MNENVNTNIVRALEVLGNQIIDIFRRKLNERKSNTSGLLGNSLSCFVETEDGIYDLYISLQDYGKYQEYGRKPGKFPPLDVIKKGIQIKPVIPDARTGKLPTLDQLTYLISRSIALNGIPPKNNLGSILDMIKQDTTLINDNVTKDLKIKVDLILKDF